MKIVLSALANVKAITGLAGRWDVWQIQPFVVADVAHNAAGIKHVMQQWQKVDADKKKIVVGFVKDKDVVEALSHFPKENTYYFCNAATPRALPAETLQVIANNVGLTGNYYPSVRDAIDAAMRDMTKEDALLITGSFFVVGEAMEKTKLDAVL